MADIHDKVADMLTLLVKAPRTRTELVRLTKMGHAGVGAYAEAFTKEGLLERKQHRGYVEYTWTGK